MRWKNLKTLGRTVVDLFFDTHIPRAAAGLSYFLTLSFFPLLICLYHMLGSMFPATEQLRDILSVIVPEGASAAILDFLRYVSENTNTSMLFMAISVLVTSSSAAFRNIDNVTAEMRGAARFTGFFELLFSIAFSLLFLAAMYLSVILIVTGKWFLELVDRKIMFMNISDSWSWMRFVLMFLLLFVILSLLFKLTAPKHQKDVRIVPGALFSAVAMVGVSIVMSGMISVNVTYPVVYGSLASLIILMFWLYLFGVVLFLGDALNVALECCGGVLRNHS